ncbi:MAG: hypothetical protein ACI97A_004023 [Planctomycetota bacterium]|jgi:hypothetical protein
MKLLPSVAILIVTVIMGQLIGTSLAESEEVSETGALEAPDREEIKRVARAHALQLIRNRVEELESNETLSKEEKQKRLAVFLTDLGKGINSMENIIERTETVVDGLSASLGAGLEPGERAVVTRTARQLNNKLVLGRTLINAKESSVRREGLRLLEEAALAGETEALDLLIASLGDDDSTFVRESMRRLANISKSELPEVVAMVKNSGLEGQLISMLPTLEGAEHTRALTALTSLGNPAAVQGWRQIYVKDGQGERNRISAAQSLKKLGSPQEYNQMLSTYDADLLSTEGRTARNAISNLGRLGGSDAKTSLKRALDADPKGTNARRIERALRELERGPRTNNRGGNRGGRR